MEPNKELALELEFEPEIQLQGTLTNMLPIGTPDWVFPTSWRITVELASNRLEVIVYVSGNEHFYKECYKGYYLQRGSYYARNTPLNIGCEWYHGAMMVLQITDPRTDETIYSYRHPDAGELRQ